MSRSSPRECWYCGGYWDRLDDPRHGCPKTEKERDQRLRLDRDAIRREALEEAAQKLPMDCHDPRHIADWLRALASAPAGKP